MFLAQVLVVAALASTNLAALPCFQCEDFSECGFAVENDVDQRLSDLEARLNVLESTTTQTTTPPIVKAVLSPGDSTPGYRSKYPIGALVDGNTDATESVSGTCFRSKVEPEPYVNLSMDQEMSVSYVRILMREHDDVVRTTALG